MTLTEGHGDTKAWKSLDFDCEDWEVLLALSKARAVGGEKVVETAKEIMRRKLLENQEKQKKEKAETSEGLDQLQS